MATPIETQNFRESLQLLIAALEAHPEYTLQLHARQGKAYFMTDFTSNTLRMLQQLPTLTPVSKFKEVQDDIWQRTMFNHILVLDSDGQFAYMYGGDTRSFGEQIEKASADCSAQGKKWAAARGLLVAGIDSETAMEGVMHLIAD